MAGVPALPGRKDGGLFVRHSQGIVFMFHRSSAALRRRALPLLVSGALAAPLAQAQTAPPQDVAYPGTLSLTVDATDLSHRVFHATQRIPVQAGPLTLLYPQWIPGNHS